MPQSNPQPLSSVIPFSANQALILHNGFLPSGSVMLYYTWWKLNSLICQCSVVPLA